MRARLSCCGHPKFTLQSPSDGEHRMRTTDRNWLVLVEAARFPSGCSRHICWFICLCTSDALRAGRGANGPTGFARRRLTGCKSSKPVEIGCNGDFGDLSRRPSAWFRIIVLHYFDRDQLLIAMRYGEICRLLNPNRLLAGMSSPARIRIALLSPCIFRL
jgi:hypothetical protein